MTFIGPPPIDKEFTEGTWQKLKDWMPRFWRVLNGRLFYMEWGVATFSAGTTVAVTLGNLQPDNGYRILLGSGANKTFWWSAKTTTGFTLNASSSSSDSIDWMVVR